MSNKRPSLKGRGMDFFLSEEAHAKPQPSAALKEAKDIPPTKATFYLPPDLVVKLDDVWMEIRKRNRKVQKSHIVAAALQLALQEYDGKQKESILERQLKNAVEK